ncbi:polyprenol phosphomannose-dependent alpha 1,6 mannosyltransferase MptB [Amycolatopsis viridis]|uniref:Alpha-1,6-mannosyltransferase n=1 Tax=Amycolatopsis viridis TaxID=185678 RepID=A0ABX0SSY0_9PSEU|nr:polyprenol phosphomannose-dependent alpha 1,6 mannosyltransferase MptB [Amycolatopsis viridis]NIH78456.1 alpha-1,6-mannosyltransferase [Amycolatopsis viridis]
MVVTSGLPVSSVVALALGLTGMGVVVLAWLELGRHASTIGVRRLYLIAATWCVPLLAARPLFSGDVYCYLAQGTVADLGFDPYRLGPAAALGADSPVTKLVSVYWQDTPAPYGPAFVELSRVIAHFAGQNVVATVLSFRLVELAGVALIAWALPRLARRTGVVPSTAVWLGLLNPLLLWHIVAGVHNEGLLMGLLLAGLEIALSGRVAAGVVLLTVAANIKFVGVAALCFLAVELARRATHTRDRVAVVFGVAAGFLLVSTAIAAGTGLGFGRIAAAGSPAQVHSWLAPTNQLGFLIGALAGTSLTDAAIRTCVWAGAVVGAVVAVRLLWGGFHGRFHAVHGVGLVFAAMLVTGPVVQPWYLLWTLLPLAAGVRTGRSRWVLAGLSAVVALLLPPAAGSPGVLFAGYLTAVFLLGGVLLLPRTRRPGLVSE